MNHVFSLEYEEVRRFADSVTPPNWNVVLHPRYYRYKPGTLNIWLQILAENEATQFFALHGPFKGRVWGPMWFTRLSSLRHRIYEANRAFVKYGDGSIARIHIQICSNMEDLLFIVIHELSHVAVTRCMARKMRPYKGDNVFVIGDPKEEGHRGPLFRKAFSRMIHRAEKAFGTSPETKVMLNAYFAYYEHLPAVRDRYVD